jgi:Tol biopolymer transport system component/DNA-binding winged helix-turn-helix (wHTH) protein
VRRQRCARFAEFELDLDAGELRRRGIAVAIPDQPLRVLELLVEHAGVLVSREQLRDRLWPADTFVDFEHGLNAAVKRLRDTLGDVADRPRFVETVPKRGYRFVAPVEGLAPPTAGLSASRRTRRRMVAALAGLGVVIVAGVAGWRLFRPPLSPEPPSTLRRLAFDSGLQTDPTISPDGTLIAYASNQSGNFDIWVRPVVGGEPFALTADPADDTQPDWSPDGKWIAFRSERTWTHAGSQRSTGGLFRVSVADRRVERISQSGFFPQISPDGARLVFNSSAFASSTYYLAAADGTGAVPIAGAPSVMASSELTAIGWHPAGRLVFLHRHDGRLRLSSLAPDSRTIVEHDTAAVQARVSALAITIADREPLAWSADGRTLYFVGQTDGLRSLWQITVDPASLSMRDGPRRITAAAGEWNGHPVATPSGGVAFASSTSARRVWLTRLDTSGRTLAEALTPATPAEWNASQPALSPDGREMVIQVVPMGWPRELRLVRLDGGTHRRLRALADDESVFMTHWSPDGRRLLYGYRFGPPGERRSSIRLLDLATLQETNVTSDAPYTAADNPWAGSRDGGSVLANGSRYVAGRYALVRLPLTAAPKAEARAAVLVTSADRGLWNASESPDGRWICYNATDVPQVRDSVLYVVPSSGGTPRVLTSMGEWDDYPRWSADGRFVYFVSTRGSGRFGLWGIPFDTPRGVAAGAAFEIAPFTPAEGSIDLEDLGFSTLSVAGSRVAVPLQYRTGGIWLLH